MDSWETNSGSIAPHGLMNIEELREALRETQHQNLVLRDVIRGLESENNTLSERWGHGDLKAAAERADQAWNIVEQKENDLNQMRHHDQVEREELERSLKSSMTWRIGNVVLAPIRFLRRKP